MKGVTMKILVCGGRDYSDSGRVLSTLQELTPSLVITGGASGADRLADQAAQRLKISRVIFPANWGGEGRSAGPIRNSLMLSMAQPDLVVAFPGGSGTQDMVKKAQKKDTKVLMIDNE